MVISWGGGGGEIEIDFVGDVLRMEFDLQVVEVPLFDVESFEWIAAASNDLFIMFIIALR